jgi:predicted O-methyltransferase YrrM
MAEPGGRLAAPDVPPMILTDAVATYLEALVPAPDPLLSEMRDHGARDRIPIVVPETGHLLQTLATATGARRVVEVGTAIGVSTLHLARAVGDGGLVVTFEIDQARQRAARGYLERAGVLDRVDLRLQDAGEGLGELDGGFDLAFLDGVKSDYARHLELVLPRLRPRGMLLVDNVLLDGEVATPNPAGHWEEATVTGMRKFTASLASRDDLITCVLPMGDGVALAVRR